MKNIFFEEDGSSILTILPVGAVLAAELDSLIAATFARCASARSALLIRAEYATDFTRLTCTLYDAMLQPAVMRPAAVSILVTPSRTKPARDLRYRLALAGVVLGVFTDFSRAETHALRERDLVLSEESSSSIALSAASSNAYVLGLRSGLNWSKRAANDSALSENCVICDV